MNNLGGFSGNGYQQRQAVIQKNLNVRKEYVNSQQQALKKQEEMEKLSPSVEGQTPPDELKAMRNLSNNSLPQNHLKFPGNNQFRR